MSERVLKFGFELVVVVLISKLYHLKSEFFHNNDDIIRLKQ